MQLHALEPLLKFSIHLYVKIFLPANYNFLGKITDKYQLISKARVWRN